MKLILYNTIGSSHSFFRSIKFILEAEENHLGSKATVKYRVQTAWGK